MGTVLVLGLDCGHESTCLSHRVALGFTFRARADIAAFAVVHAAINALVNALVNAVFNFTHPAASHARLCLWCLGRVDLCADLADDALGRGRSG
jgi:hypothetical protein